MFAIFADAEDISEWFKSIYEDMRAIWFECFWDLVSSCKKYLKGLISCSL